MVEEQTMCAAGDGAITLTDGETMVATGTPDGEVQFWHQRCCEGQQQDPPEFSTAQMRLRAAVIAAQRARMSNEDIYAAIAPLFVGTVEGPPLPHGGTGGRWEKLGDVGVDSATIAITDPAFAPRSQEEYDASWDQYRYQEGLASPYGNSSGVQFMSGFGDGRYEVWGWVADYSNEGEREDRRVAQVVMTLITAEDFTDWHRDDSVVGG